MLGFVVLVADVVLVSVMLVGIGVLVTLVLVADVESYSYWWTHWTCLTASCSPLTVSSS